MCGFYKFFHVFIQVVSLKISMSLNKNKVNYFLLFQKKFNVLKHNEKIKMFLNIII